ncbi:MAG: hypothetical protein ACR2LI_03180 [Propionibacteriaceae bacterium]
MSTKPYLVPAWAHNQVAKMGWNEERQSYWFVVYRLGPFGETEVSDPEVSYTIGVDRGVQITNVGQLIMYTWAEIDWATPDGLYAIRGLRDDPIFEALYGGPIDPEEGVEDFICHAFDSRAITAANDAVRGHSKLPEPVPTALAGQPVIPVPTTEARMPAHRRRFFRRSNPAG